MAAQFFVFALALLSCVSDSWQRCFSYHCAHHSMLKDCVQGSYQCQADEFCETKTHLNHGNAPWVMMDCRPNAEMADCLAMQAVNDPKCDPNNHDIICHWCCDGEQCMRDMVTGVLPTGGAPAATSTPAAATTAAAATVTVPPDMTMAPAGTTMAPAGTTMAPAGTTMAPAATTMAPAATTMAGSTAMPCDDVYLGDCSIDYSGRCSEPLVQQLCMKTCGKCP